MNPMILVISVHHYPQGRGHIAHEEDPKGFAKLVANFVAKSADKRNHGLRDFGNIIGISWEV